MSGINLLPEEKDIRRIVAAIRSLFQGRVNATGMVTLRAGQTTTTVANQVCALGDHVDLFPKTANAAAALATTYILEADVLQGSFTITHANGATLDRTFSYGCRG
jgi:hypothetical protein